MWMLVILNELYYLNGLVLSFTSISYSTCLFAILLEAIKALHTITLKSTNCFLPTNNALNLLRNVEHADSQSPLNLIHRHKHEDHIIDHEKSEASKQHRRLVDQSKYVIQREHNQRIHRREVITESSSAQVRQIHANRQERIGQSAENYKEPRKQALRSR